MLQGEPALVDRALLVNELRFDPDAIYELDRPLLLMPGDQVHRRGQQVIVKRVTGNVEAPAGRWEPWAGSGASSEDRTCTAAL
ncbi:hypothetical protein M2158_009902 [Streptomyces sp. SAI-144]|nr:hypothetical protein [Streptomyces sp. SAI-144]